MGQENAGQPSLFNEQPQQMNSRPHSFSPTHSPSPAPDTVTFLISSLNFSDFLPMLFSSPDDLLRCPSRVTYVQY